MNRELFIQLFIKYMNSRYDNRYNVNEDFLVSIKEIEEFLDTRDSFHIKQEWMDE